MKVYRCTFYGPHLHPQIRVENVEEDAEMVSKVRNYDPGGPRYSRKSGGYDPWKNNPIGKQPVFRVLVPIVQGMTKEEGGEKGMEMLIEWLQS